jgi:hypothetical protein
MTLSPALMTEKPGVPEAQDTAENKETGELGNEVYGTPQLK